MYLQRQISAFIGNSSYTDPVRYGIGDRIWASQDVYPAKIQILNDGDIMADEITFAALGSGALPLPSGYTSAGRLSVFMRVSSTVKIVIVSPSVSTSTVLVKAGTATDSNGFFSFTGRVTSMTVTNPSATAAATVEYFAWEYPSDITVAAAWRDGAQTIGTAPTS